MSFLTWLNVPRVVPLVPTFTFHYHLTLILFINITILISVSRILTLSCHSMLLTFWWYLSKSWSQPHILWMTWFISWRFVELTEYILNYLCSKAWEAEDTLSSYLSLGSRVTAWDWKIVSFADFRINTKDWTKVIWADLSGHFSSGKVYSTFSWGSLLQGLKLTLPAGMTPLAEAICTKMRT